MDRSRQAWLGVVARAATIALVGLTLVACSNIKKQLGLGKQAPDEFRVVTRAPLSLPPDFSLRPPEPGAARPQESTQQERARAALLGASTATASQGGENSPGEQAILARAGVEHAQSDIRRVLNEEHDLYADDDKSFVDALMFWHEKQSPGVIVDPAKEAQRLQEASALGKPPTEGETAVIKRRKKALLEGIF